MIELIMAAVVIVLLIVFLIYCLTDRRSLYKAWQHDKLTWDAERQKLLDRIQAPSFEVYKHAEIVRAKVDKQEPKQENHIEEV